MQRQELGVLLVECAEYRFILAADALIGVAHHFRRDMRLTVGYALVVLDDLRLDVVKSKVRLPRFHALAFGTVALCVPKYL